MKYRREIIVYQPVGMEYTDYDHDDEAFYFLELMSDLRGYLTVLVHILLTGNIVKI